MNKKIGKVIAIQADPLETFNIKTDTTVIMAAELQSRGYEIFFYEPKNLSVLNDNVYAHGIFVKIKQGSLQFFEVIKTANVDLKSVMAVLIRQNPPLNMEYIMTTYMLDLLSGETLVLNNPTAIRNYPEKFFAFLLKDFLPKSILTSSVDDIKSFLKNHKCVVLKPFDGFAGLDVIKLHIDDNNLGFILNSYLEKHHFVVAQEFLDDVYHLDKRILMIDGEVVGAFGRIPQAADFRTNSVYNAKVAPAKLTKNDEALCSALRPILKQNDLLLAGIDVIGNHLIEVNITSPSTLTIFNEIYGTKIEIDLVNAIERRMNHCYSR